MREISKLFLVFLIGVGMILCVIMITPRKRNRFVVVSQWKMDKSLESGKRIEEHLKDWSMAKHKIHTSYR